MSNKASGEFILQNFDIFNEAVYFFDQTLNPAIENGIDECIRSFASKNHWNHECELQKNNRIWLHPPYWKTDATEAWFELSCTENNGPSKEYWLTLLFQKSIKNDVAGFFFSLDTKFFGGKRKWDSILKNTSKDYIKQLLDMGFKPYQGNYYLPICLNPMECAQSWQADDPYTADDDCFSPLRETLEQLKASVPIFDAILQEAAQQRC